MIQQDSVPQIAEILHTKEGLLWRDVENALSVLEPIISTSKSIGANTLSLEQTRTCLIRIQGELAVKEENL